MVPNRMFQRPISGRTESWRTDKSQQNREWCLMNTFLRARTAFGFEYLISFLAEHSDAEIYITGIELVFRNRHLKQSENRPEDSKLAKQVNTISQIFPRTGRVS